MPTTYTLHVYTHTFVIILFIAGADPYYDAAGGRGEAAERMMDIDRRELPPKGEPTNRISIASKLQSFDYSHGSTNLKTVDYNHGTSSGAPAATQAYQDSAYPPSFDVAGYGGAGGREAGGDYPYEGYRYPPLAGGGGYPPGAGSFLPSGLDAATLFAAYASQAGTPTSDLDPVHNNIILYIFLFTL